MAHLHSGYRAVGIALCLLAALPLLLAAGPFVQPAAAAPPPFRVLNVGTVGLSVTTLNPMRISVTEDYVITYNVYSTLLTFDKGYATKADLAYSWSLAPDNVTWTFRLVQNAYFIDPMNPSDRSHPVTADDVVYTYNLQKSLSKSVYYPYVTDLSSITMIDTYTVSIVTARPLATMFATARAVPILPRYVWGSINKPYNYANTNPIGSGVLYFDTANTTLASNIIFRRNPAYYGTTYYCQFSRPDEVRFLNFADAASLAGDFLAGTSGLNAIYSLDAPSYLGPLASWSPKWAVDQGFVGEFSINVMTPAIRSAFAQFKTGSNNPLLLNATVRRAVAMSVNKSALVDSALFGLGRVADSLVPSSNPWHLTIPPAGIIPFDPQGARQMLRNAGWAFDQTGNAAGPNQVPLYQAGGTNPLAFRFYTLNSPAEWNRAASNLSTWLAQAGIQTTDRLGNPGYSLLNFNQMNSAWFAGDYDLWLWAWLFSPGTDPSLDILFVETTMAIGTTADNYFSDPTYDALYNQSVQTIDLAARRTITDTMQKMVYDYASYILPYYRYDLYAATNSAVGGRSYGWQNWGNWSATPGLTPDSDLPVLWTQVEPTDNRAPSIGSFASVAGSAGIPTTITVAATDPENAIQTYDWDFGDGTTVTSSTATVQHTYGSTGNYSLKVRVTDTEWPACATSSATIGIGHPIATFVHAPLYPGVGRTVMFDGSSSAYPGVPNATLQARWDFNGDGTWDTPYSTLLTATSGYASAGNHTAGLEILAPDGTTNVSQGTVSVDGTPPVTTATITGTSGSNGWYVSSISVALAATDDLSGPASTSFRIDGGAWQAYTVPFAVSGDGTHSVDFYSTDNGGNVETPQSAVVRIDGSAPVTQGTASGTTGSSGWYVSTVTVTLSASDPNSGVAATSYRVDSSVWQPYSAPFPVTADGPHAVDYNSVDSAGNLEVAGQLTFRIDATAPVTTRGLTGTAGNGNWWTSSVDVSLGATDLTSGVLEIRYRVDGGPWSVYGVVATVSGDGTHTVDYFSRDVAGNAEATQSVRIDIDGTAPTTAADLSGVIGSNGWYRLGPSVMLVANDVTSGLASVAYRLDGGPWQPYGAPIVLADGRHTVEYYATDMAGNVEAAKVVSVNVDATAPSLQLEAVPAILNVSSVDVAWTGSDSASGIARFEVSVDGGVFQAVGLNTTFAATLADGSHTITVRAVDGAGNEVTQSVSFRVETTVSGPSGPANGFLSYLWIVGIVAGAIVVILLWRRRKEKPETPEGALPPQAELEPPAPTAPPQDLALPPPPPPLPPPPP